MSKSQTSPQIPPKYLQEDETSDECKKLLLTLPKERGWLASHIYNYQGFWAQDSDIILVTTPKSGTTWLKSLLFDLVNQMKYLVFEQNHPLLVKNPHDLIPFLEIRFYGDGLVPNFASFTSPRLLSTHMPFASLPKSVQDSKTKLVYLCRNPKDTFISLWHFTNNLRLHHKDIHPIEEKFESFCKGIEKPNKVLFLMYEEIKVQTKLQLKHLAEFLECPFSIEEENCGVMDEILRMCTFENLSNLEVNTNGKLSTGEENKVFFRKEEDELSDEGKKLLLTLPKERGWLASHSYNYQGFWATPRIIQGVIACQQQFQAQDSDIILVTIPKSGTTCLKALLFGLVNQVKYPIFEQNHPLLIKKPHDLVPYLELTLYVDGQVPNFSSITTPRLLNSKDTFISMWHFTNKLKLDHKDINSIGKVFDLFCNGVSLYGPFWNHVLDYYWKASIEKSNKVIFFMYEEIKEQPKIQIKCLAEFLECPFPIKEENCGVVDEILRICSFENLSNLEVNTNGKLSSGEENKVFFRKGKVGDWKNYFTIEMNEKLNHIIEQKFEGSGLRF
ncbi:hypothetical protein H5410_025119 [Solanum commersonii]|uniref:Sulfotransferase n=1 Tax=Solanum commersonii TaxID=4109 RepID=A0A9J5YS87_SOLCO|nr:hypothetical protein H5410_025119 [Solanum commersonii]